MKVYLPAGRFVVLVILFGLALGGCDRQARCAHYLDVGRTYYLQGHYRKAANEFRDAAEIEPKNSEVYYWYGLTQDKQKNFPQAFANYAEAVKLNPNYLAAKARLGKLYLRGGDIPKAEQMASEILAARPSDPDGRILDAAVMARQGNIAGAIQEAGSVVGSDPKKTDAVSLLAALYTSESHEGKALKVLEQGVAASPRSVQLRMNLVAVLAKLKRPPSEMAQQLKEMIAINPSNFAFRLDLARLYVITGQVAKAKAVLASAVRADPHDNKRYLAYSSLLASSGDVPAGERELKKAIRARPKAYDLQFALAKFYLLARQPAKAQTQYRKIINENHVGPSAMRARIKLAALMLGEGKLPAARKLINAVLDAHPADDDALLVRGEIELADKNPQAAVGDFRVVLRDQPNAVNVIDLLAKAHLENNDPALAKETFEKAIGAYPDNLNVRLDMAEMLVSTKDYAGAEKQLRAIIARAPKAVIAYADLAGLDVTQNHMDDAISWVHKGLSAVPNSPQLMVELAELYQHERNTPKAVATYNAILKRYPNLDIAANNLAVLLVSSGMDKADRERALSLAQRFAHSTDPAFLDTLGWAYVRNKQYGHGVATLRRATHLAPKAGIIQYHLGMAYYEKKDMVAAARHLKAAVASKGLFPEKRVAVKILARLAAAGH
ncbi:MAG: tetratricopeptide repeat protein [Acidiferrobacteraceae bacterium]